MRRRSLVDMVPICGDDSASRGEAISLNCGEDILCSVLGCEILIIFTFSEISILKKSQGENLSYKLGVQYWAICYGILCVPSHDDVIPISKCTVSTPPRSEQYNGGI